MSHDIIHSSFLDQSTKLTENLLLAVENNILRLIKTIPQIGLMNALNLQKALADHVSSGGQRVRARLALDCALALGISYTDAVTLATSVELVHNASLIHDDLQDRDRVRRGNISVWAAYGGSFAICAGDMLLSLAYQALTEFSVSHLIPHLMTVLHSKIAQAIVGQCSDLQILQRLVDSVKLYEEIVIHKSGALLILPLELTLVAAGKSQSIAVAIKTGQSLSLGYQIIDDLADLRGDTESNERPASLNICSVLQAAKLNVDYRTEARTLALKHLTEAQNAAQNMPHGSGGCVIDLAQRLAQRL
jgi:geranylgeranyl pyrophosphate synthase